MTSVTALTGGWRLRGFLGDDWQLHRAQLHARDGQDDERRWIPARVPGSVLADLLAAGQVPSPYVGTQSLLSEWVPQRTWVYRTRLRTAGLAPTERAFLEFDGIDYSAAVYLDGERIAVHEGTFVPRTVEVTGRLGPGEHTLAVVVDAAPVSQPQVGYTAQVNVHKGRMGYGWDFCPRIVHQGLWGPVRLRTTGPLRLADVWARPTVTDTTGRVTVTVSVDGAATGASAECTLHDPAGATVAKATVPLDGPVTEVALQVDAPLRWELNGRGDAHRYALRVALHDGGGARSDEHQLRLGFRDVRFSRDADAPATALPYRLTVNGRPSDIRGWNWVPADALYGAVDEARLRHLLGLARDAGVTMLRVWGGGLIESSLFYDLCDEFGILVWQEFAQSSSGMRSVPSEEVSFVARMVAEAEQIVPARRNHPSLAIWCGGNELQRADGVPLTDADSPVLAALHDVVARLDPDRQWLPTSPSGPVFGNTLDSVRTSPEQHDVHGPWEHQGLSDHYRLYDSGRGLLLSEFGVEGMSNVRAIESVVPAPQRVLPTAGDPVWDHLGRWWNNEPLVRQAFGDALTDLAALSRASQFLQADGLRYAVEANRRRPESCGVLPWQLNESFPNGWCTAAVDYFGEPKAAYHYVRRAYRPLHVCAALPAPRITDDQFAATVWAWWDTASGPARVTARVVRLDGSQVAEAHWATELVAGRPQPLGEIRCSTAELGGTPFLLDLSVHAGTESRTNRYLLTAGPDFRDLLALPPAGISTRLHTSGATWTLRLRHETGPAGVFLRLLDARPAAEPGWPTWDDNAIDLLPGEERVLHGRWDGVPSEDRRVRLDGWNVPARLITEVG
ncbi:glycoside hydrolase family 2 TIM barrel-domain containing protein [Micromonospora soli]|uniref:glycoside hydrolase family 2 protein n=1 Tax=Micromonospora sp. NBRC 110009 TaxID=3061627 RepID=UPI002672A3EB|nr:glycoside hydrolase family 2 TIM barrel-domain containing protein [Micromonospora sp. NBRC 110009]WKT99191.1 glycoside hydrolase family 2 TIM barrel-domain containing protein [Micromonospora sp. NBRC 110009]